MGGGTSRSTKAVRGDLSKYIVPGRKLCYCMTTLHPLINNCVSCGKIICEQEGEGPCLFCGAWIDRETMQEHLDDEDAAHYENALMHRDKLIDFDLNSAKRLGVLDERSDWYDLANNTWLNKDQRKFANTMMENQKKKDEEVDKQNVLSIDLETGKATIVKDVNEWSAFNAQNEQVNTYMAEYKNGMNDVPKEGAKYKPFEFMGQVGDDNNTID